jgi:hypothetical protein
LGTVGLACLLFGARARSGQPEKTVLEKPDQGKKYFGVERCIFCHAEPKNLSRPLLCKCDEIVTWKRDRHSQAWEVLQTERAARMGQLLHYQDVTRQEECLRCHAQVVDDPSAQHPSFNVKEGVSCTVCHGGNDKWIDAHFKGDLTNAWWRGKSRKEKETAFGLRDLWDPVTRAQLCLSCHIGNTAESKFVTHAMYAAGHPPLPGIEVATYCEAMPPHWQPAKDKSDEVKKLLALDPDQARFERTQLVLVSAAVGLRESLQLVATQAARADDQPLDLALFDCYACHHELKEDGWRPRRGYAGGKPGRPQLPPWPTTVVRTGLRSLGRPDTAVDEALKPLIDVFDARPFGEPRGAAKAARTAMAWTDQLIADLRARRITDKEARSLLEILSRSEGDRQKYPDYDSARLRAWAFTLIYGEWRPTRLKDLQIGFAPLQGPLQLSLTGGPGQDFSRRAEYEPGLFTETFHRRAADLLQRAEK